MSDQPSCLSVRAFLDCVNETLRLIPSRDFVVEGEVSDFRVAQGKWVSFDLKDEQEEAVLKCFMTAWQLQGGLEDGMRVQVRGYPKVYERYGQFKMNVTEVTPVGEGALRRAYDLLKKKLQEEGLFDVARKRTPPRFPTRIGLITSRDAAAYGDFLRILHSRWSGVSVIHANVHVQGKEAVEEIVSALSVFSALPAVEQPDVIVLTRGGGGLEDLHAFNDERVARAVFSSCVPVVCAVGHERDESLCDFVADVRASTPTHAAECVVPNRQEILFEIASEEQHMERTLQEAIQRGLFVTQRAMQAMGLVMARKQDHLRRARENFVQRSQAWLPKWRERLEGQTRLLRQLDPTRVLSRGYSIVREGSQVLRDACGLEIGSSVRVQLAAGSFDADVTQVNGEGQISLL